MLCKLIDILKSTFYDNQKPSKVKQKDEFRKEKILEMYKNHFNSLGVDRIMKLQKQEYLNDLFLNKKTNIEYMSQKCCN
ncbi:hypothetical protein E7Y35_02035 [Spiroplasma sp. SV19]|nr:hypothetical protein E7Y35_02035 [Spiroplasma sp. SV19]